MIVYTCGYARSTDSIKEQLQECGAEVCQSFQLIPGVAAGLSPDALKKFFARYPGATVQPDRRRQIPPMPFGPDDRFEIAAPRPAADGQDEAPAPSPANAEMSPLALSLIHADAVQAMGIDGSGVRICIIDSGVDFNHPDLQGTALVGPDGNFLAVDFTETDLADTIGHGTAVAGSIAAQAKQIYPINNEVTGKPVAYTRIKGMAPGVKLMSAKVFDARVPSGYDTAIIAALEWAAEQGAQIVNMSLGGGALPNDGNDPLAAAVTALRQRGILVVVASGNEGGGQGSVSSPGSSPGALTVGASTMYRSFAEMGFLAEGDRWTVDQLASFSSLGPAADGRLKPDILAPGAFDWGLAPLSGSEEGQNMQLFGGTSQATPLMSGAAALVYQAFFRAKGRYPSADEAMRIVCSTTDDLGLPAHMQGAGRVNALRAVQAVTGTSQAAVTFGPLSPVSVLPGQETSVNLELTNLGSAAAQVPVSAYTYAPADLADEAFNGEIATGQTPQEIMFMVPEHTDLMQISLDWPTEDHGPRSPRLMVAMYDPRGNFVNYQRPNGSGDVELGKSVDCWIARPEAGSWTARIVLRLGKPDTVQPFTLAIRRFRRSAWGWVSGPAQPVMLAPGEAQQTAIAVRVPEGTIAGTYAGHIVAGSLLIPFAVVVPIALNQGQGTFAGAFQHGYQGSYGNGDWLYHDLPVPAGTRSLVASLQWPDVDNALECYLIDPNGVAVMGRSNDKDILDDGDSRTLGGQFVLAHPEPGNWRLVLHSFAFCGRGMPEPYFGTVETAGELVSPKIIQLRVSRGQEAPMALSVANPGRLPMTVQAMAQSTEARLVWKSLAGEVKSGVTREGRPEGDANVALGTIDVPVGARQLGAVLNWDEPGVEVSLSLFDPVSQSDRSTISSDKGQVALVESNPVPGQWTVMAGITSPTGQTKAINLTGSTFVVAPLALEGVSAQPVTIQPGRQSLVPLTVKLPESANAMMGRIVVTTTKGDRLGEVAFRIQAGDSGADAEAASTSHGLGLA
jgi:subtilisin family serine protease